jgi:transcriptional regulator with XRE-family HTH domain
LSQLALGVAADVSQRHISFIETGRSTPSRELVGHLGRVLDVPLRDQNVMLMAAGHAPTHPETDPLELARLLPALQFVVDAHTPYMAVVVDRAWNVIASNSSAQVFASLVLDPAEVIDGGTLNLMRATFHPRGLRRHITNWPAVWPMLLAGLERDSARAHGDVELASLVDEVRGHLSGETPGGRGAQSLLVPLRYDIDGVMFDLFTTIATIDAALDVTVSELRIETFWPADEASDAAWRRLVEVT